MYRCVAIFMLIACMAFSCKKEQNPEYSGTAVFTSEPRGEYFTEGYGFSFELGKNITCPNLNCTGADVVAGHLILQTEIEEVFLQSPENLEAFFLNGSFDTEAEAIAYYDDYSEVTATDFDYEAGDLQENQVWTVQTLAKKYAKFRIIRIVIYNDVTYPYADVVVQYQYQPGGSKTFSR